MTASLAQTTVDTPTRWDYIRREWEYWARQYRARWKGTVVVSIANPVLFLIAIGAGLGRLVTPTAGSTAAVALGGVSYLAFFAPGMLAAASMQNGIIESAFPVARGRMKDGPYQPAVSSPLEPTDILFGHVLFMAARIAMSAAAFILVMIALGAARSWLVLLTLPAATLTGLAFATPVAAWAVTLDEPSRVVGLFKWVVMPMYLFSGTFFAVSQLPDWLQPVVMVTPLWHGVDLCRTLSLGTATWGTSIVHIGYLAVLTGVGLVVGARNFQKHLHS
jgi:lipooligosaccharide transport system permease protein